MTNLELNQNPLPVPEGDHPVLDELITVGLMAGTTLRQMREMAHAIHLTRDYGGRTGTELGLATGVIYLVDRIEEMVS